MEAQNQPSVSFVAPQAPDDESGHLHRQAVGYLGMLLAPLVWFISALRTAQGPKRWHHLPSISEYYYTGAVAAFTGILVALAVFFFTYKGYANKSGRWDRIAGLIAGIAALLVAFFPTKTSVPAFKQDWWDPRMGIIHGVSATILFADFAFFALVLFPQSSVSGAELSRGKKKRNYVYYGCGGAMFVCMGWAGLAEHWGAPIFWAETGALEFFAMSWLLKGRAEWTAGNAIRHPVQFAATVHRAIQRGSKSGRGNGAP